ncbi:restriction endonuclease subunit S [Bacteroides fragilis]|uniref:restriction endonuclease subunit S n=4 Tax=Bacteroides fragilis TaxID=817 RepID=UPI0004481253|nr:restriction endonuclease subunit S [Bacteroides fragilis]EXY19035.1 type I restriction modification DNA specificity domain protein [Bacteroides fragilis str. 2-F-2 \
MWTTLGEVGTWQSGGTPSRSNKSYYGGNIPWLKTGDLNDGLITDIPESITEEAVSNSSAKLNPIGSVLIAMYGATIGKLGILTIPATTNQACCACVEYLGITQLYLFYFLLSQREAFVAKGGGGAQPNISKEIIVNTYFPLPPYAEQQRIVAEIERWFSLIDIIENGKEDLQTSIKQAKSKILDLAIHGKLVPQDPSDEPASELLKRINSKAEITSDNEHYTQLPKGWAIGRIDSVVRIINGKSQKDVESHSGAYPIYGSGGIIGRANEYLCPAGSTVIGRKGTINNPIYVKEQFWNVDTAFGIKPSEAVNDLYFYYFCLLFDFSKLDKSTALPSLTKTAIGNLILPIPPYQEQCRIIEAINKYNQIFDKIMESL